MDDTTTREGQRQHACVCAYRPPTYDNSSLAYCFVPYLGSPYHLKHLGSPAGPVHNGVEGGIRVGPSATPCLTYRDDAILRRADVLLEHHWCGGVSIMHAVAAMLSPLSWATFCRQLRRRPGRYRRIDEGTTRSGLARGRAAIRYVGLDKTMRPARWMSIMTELRRVRVAYPRIG